MAINNVSRVIVRCVAAVCACGLVTPAVLKGSTPFTLYSVAGDRTTVQSVVNAYRTALGPDNGNLPGQQPAGSRTITWDDVGGGSTVTNFPTPMTTYNTSPRTRGAVFTNALGFMVSTDFSTFYGEGIFPPFSGGHLFGPGPLQPPVTDVRFFVAGTDIPATVSGFGAVFSDVDLPDTTSLEFFNARGESIAVVFAPTANLGLSFVGLTFVDQRVARVHIITGNTPLGFGNQDGPSQIPGGPFEDIVPMDDFIYGEPSVVGPPTGRDQCKDEGWTRFDFPRVFSNQGDCIQFVNTGN